MQLMTPLEWEDCFNHVLYPLLSNLLQMHNNNVEIKFLEESRIRTITFVSKIYLHHLNLLSTIDNYHQLWLTLLDFMQKFMYVDNSELLFEAIPECLKNMVLVMNSANLFENKDENSLWFVTWRRIDEFLPNLKNELFNENKSEYLFGSFDRNRSFELFFCKNVKVTKCINSRNLKQTQLST